LGFQEPLPDCSRCPRLVDYRANLQAGYPSYFNRPVPAFGSLDCKLLIVGLAPGKSGANRTGRPFTGDYAGELLYATLAKFGFSSGKYSAAADDGLLLQGARITNAVRCVPPDNRPDPKEVRSCRPYLTAELQALPSLKAILVLGHIAHTQVIAAMGLPQRLFSFRHGNSHDLINGLALFDSYHCSRYNTNTRRLTQEMFEAVFAEIRTVCAES
jgi:uracil-DNA glycosylase family 4